MFNGGHEILIDYNMKLIYTLNDIIQICEILWDYNVF